MEILIESNRFNVWNEESTDGTLGKSVANWLMIGLSRKGFSPKLEKKEFSWQLTIPKEDMVLYIKIQSIWKDAQEVGESMLAWKILTGYKLINKSTILSFFKRANPERELYKLNWAIKEFISSEQGIKILNMKEDLIEY
ncbi:hypothetical protein [Persephonella sp. KM09-Lau-8]|uniref:hypothetical protein n=1 Tax=Persephonella sp. KM09-Lau-8 TaxID=1158345 RepID=UPI0004965BF0|nr:hypothetical protein [Persephonella sp. KM09-Lau-8]